MAEKEIKQIINGDTKMNKILFPLVALLFLFIGCQDNNSILSPEAEHYEASTLNKGRIIIDKKLKDDDLDWKDDLNFDFKYDDDEKKLSFVSKNFTVDGNIGDELTISETYLKNGRLVSMSAKLVIPQKAFKGTLTFDMIFDFDNYSVELYPSPFIFDKPVILDLTFWGVNFNELATTELDFNYLDGEKENLNYEKININKNWGLLYIQGAQISHFSRYGWVRKK